MPFEVALHPEKWRIVITLTGMASIDDVTKFDLSLQNTFTRVPVKRSHQLLYDVSNAKVQSQDVVAALREVARRSRQPSAFAVVNARALAGLQLKRIFEGIAIEMFDTIGEATVWLDSR